MTDIQPVLLILLASLVVGTLLYFPFRWVVLRNVPESARLPEVTRRQYLQAIIVVAAMLVLAWYMEAGSFLAGALFAAVGIAAIFFSIIIARRAHREDDDA